MVLCDIAGYEMNIFFLLPPFHKPGKMETEMSGEELTLTELRGNGSISGLETITVTFF